MTDEQNAIHPQVQRAQEHLATSLEGDLAEAVAGLTEAAHSLESALADDSDPGDPAAPGR